MYYFFLIYQFSTNVHLLLSQSVDIYQNIKITSLLCALILLISNISFALAGVNESALIIITALVLLLCLLVIYLLPKKGI